MFQIPGYVTVQRHLIYEYDREETAVEQNMMALLICRVNYRAIDGIADQSITVI